MKNGRKLKDEFESFGMQANETANPQTAAPEAEKPWTTYYNSLLESAKNRKAKAQGVVDQNQVTREDLDALATDRNQRTVASGLQNAANQFLSVGGETLKNNLNETFDALNKGQTDDLASRQKLAAQASQDLKQANEDIGSAFKQPFEMAKLQAEREESDPNSEASQSARNYLKATLGVDIPPTMSAKQLAASSTIQPLMTKWQADRAESQRLRDIEVQDRRDRENRDHQTNLARQAQAAAAAEHEKTRKAAESQLSAKQAFDRELAALKAKTPKAQFEQLAPDKQETVKGLAKKNAEKTSIKNQIDGYLKQFQAAPTNDEKIRIGRQMIKVLNSPEGADAVGAEEVKRLAGALEINFLNFTNPGPVFGRDLPGFEQQVKDTSGAVEKGIQANQAVIDQNMGRPSQAGKPKTVRQNGHTYTLNEATGEYE